MLVYLSAAGLVTAYLKIRWTLEKPSREVETTVAATVVSKEVKSGTHETGRSVMGYSFVINFETADGNALELYPKEFDVLYYLAMHPDWVLSAEQIYQAVWHDSIYGCEHVIYNTISQIRKKLNMPDVIKTVRNRGYRYAG